MAVASNFGVLVLNGNATQKSQKKAKLHNVPAVYSRAEVVDDFLPELELFQESHVFLAEFVFIIKIQRKVSIIFFILRIVDDGLYL